MNASADGMSRFYTRRQAIIAVARTARGNRRSAMEPRLEKIEAKLSLAEDLLEELNKTVYRQQRQLEQMQQEIVSLRQQVQNNLPAEPRNLQDEVPPHY
jgi:SlyX protein